jgi:transposase
MDYYERVVSDYQAGLTTPKIAELYGVTYQRIQQILKKYNVTRFEGGSHIRHQTLTAFKNEERNTKCLERNGCTYEQYKTLPREAKYVYQSHRRNAKKRNIEWAFTMWTWWGVWDKSGKWEERGRGLGYCMVRKGNVGIYEPGNVYICTGQQSMLDYYASDLYRNRKKVAQVKNI